MKLAQTMGLEGEESRRWHRQPSWGLIYLCSVYSVGNQPPHAPNFFPEYPYGVLALTEKAFPPAISDGICPFSTCPSTCLRAVVSMLALCHP